MLLVLLLGGGAYGAWWYNQQQYYVGVQDGYVAIFQGTNQSVAGMSLSKLLTRSTLQVSQLGLNDQGTLAQTISKGSVNDAKALIDTLQAHPTSCHRQWTALAAWQAQSVKYQTRPGQGGAQQAEDQGSGVRRPRPDAGRARSGQLRPGLRVRHPGVGAAPRSRLRRPPPPATTPTAKPSVKPPPRPPPRRPRPAAAG